MVTGIIIGALLMLLVVWTIGVRRRLTAMEENISNAMCQIGVQLSSRFDALTTLLTLVEGYAPHESQTLLESVNARRSALTALSTPEEVRKQEEVISETLERLTAVTAQHPELKDDETYHVCIAAVDGYEKMVCTSHLIYNDGVAKLNRELGTFPASLLGGVLGFHPRAQLEESIDRCTRR